MSQYSKVHHLLNLIELGRKFNFLEHPEFLEETLEDDIEDFMDYFSEALPAYRTENEFIFISNFTRSLEAYFPDEDCRQVVIDCLILRLCYHNSDGIISFKQIQTLTNGDNRYSATIFDAIKESNKDRLEFFWKYHATKDALTYLKSTGFSPDDVFLKRSGQKLGDILVMPVMDLTKEMFMQGEIQFTAPDKGREKFEKLMQHALSLYPASDLQISDGLKPTIHEFKIADIFNKYLPDQVI